MAESEEIQRHLRDLCDLNLLKKTGRFILKAPTNLKSEIWQKFHMVFQKKENDDSEIPVNYYCACIKCNKISAEEKKFKRNLMADLDVWMMTELDLVANKMRQRRHAAGMESRVAGTSAQQDVEDDYTQPTKKARFDPFADLRDGCSSSTSKISTAELSGHEELARYKALNVPANHKSLLAYWQDNSKDFILLSNVARRVLCISASSAQSERDFSSVGRTVTDARSSLSARKVEELELIRWGCRASVIDIDKL
ncbi:hypothetical protein HELRODRAFT_188558 [Helobdella robusta]|uniref:HAT C-terminal dimerisation domain-containing protein n=1 Tax=Helobdella robusta TaxID=6412 RepID=T1FQ44_HELRO|nr:hypothetical protein HELRODRAFT_188558 [Helobdella robusta]ESO02047.1 hypothetical protein HELRODRAFT_188558 [Helobdella robusta]